MAKLTQQQLETHLWGAANILRGKTAGQDYKNYILSLMFYKRLSDQWENEADDAIAELENQQSRKFSDIERAVFRARGEHRFVIPDGARWGDVKAASVDIGEVLTKAMRTVADSNEELRGVFTVDWHQPAPDGSGRRLIANEVVHALIQHFDEHDLSNKSVPADILGRAYEYLIKRFADDAGAKAGEFFTPPAVVDALVRMVEPQPEDAVYDPTAGSGGMLVHSADYLKENGHQTTSARYFAQEMNWGNAAIGKINSVLHGLEADIRAGYSTITDPQFMTDDGHVRQFSVVLANFPFSDEFWWLKPEQQTDDKKKRERLKKEVFGKEGYKDPYGRFGRATGFHAPPAGYGDYAFILHILASLSDAGRAGVVCPQGILFRGQPEMEEDTGEFDADGVAILRRRKADDEYLIRKALLETQTVEAVISLPLNIFYGAGIPACLLILRKNRPTERKNQLLLIYAARHYRELSAQNELRPQDVMRILVHFHAYGDAAKVPELLEKYSRLIREQIDAAEADEVGRYNAEAEDDETTLQASLTEIEIATALRESATLKKEINAAAKRIAQALKQEQKARIKLAERDEKVAGARRTAQEDRSDLSQTVDDLLSIYADPAELNRHARVVELPEIVDNEFNLNIPRYVDTFEPEEELDVSAALKGLLAAEDEIKLATTRLLRLMSSAGYEAD